MELPAAPSRPWPDAVDSLGILLFATVAFGVPLFGYTLMVLDVRRWLRSFRRALVVVGRVVTPVIPYWAHRDRPPCMAAFDLALPCSEAEVWAAYRRKAKDMHPDRGGSLEQFLKLQKHFEQALHLVRSRAAARATSES